MTSDSYWAATPETRRLFSASGMPAVVGGSDILREILPACSLLADGLDIEYLKSCAWNPERSTPHSASVAYERPVTPQERHVEHPLRFVLVRQIHWTTFSSMPFSPLLLPASESCHP